MPVFTASPLRPNERPSPMFIDRGLDGLSASALGRCGVYATHDKGYEQLAYAGYKSNIAAFLHATIVKKKTLVTARGYPLPIPSDMLVPVSLPPLAFYHNTRSRDAIETFKVPFGDRIREVPVGKNSMLVLSHYTLEETVAISSQVTIEVRGPIGTCSIQNLRTFLTTVKILSAFLATHTYPGYKSTTEIHEYLEETGPIDVSVSATLESDSEGEEDEEMEDSFGIKGIIRGDQKMRKTHLVGVVSGKHGVITAKPSPLPPSVNMGTINEVPSDLPGIVFPYFEGLLEADGYTLSTTVQRFFYRNFGETDEQCHHGFTMWRRGVSEWIRTDAGLALSHIFFGIQMALESQTRLFVVVEESRYVGFVLLGGHFHVSAQGQIHRPLFGMALTLELLKMSQHTDALREIAELLSKKPMKEHGNLVEVEKDNLQKSRDVMRAIWEREEFSGEEMKELKKHVSRIHFVKPAYLQPTIENLKRLLVHMANPSSTTFDDEAMYINPGRLYVKDPKYVALAAFGSTAPSFVNAQGLAHSIPAPGEHDPANVVVEGTGKRTMDLLIMTMKPIEVAFEDWKVVLSQGAIRVNQLERAAPARTYVYKGENRDVLWEHMKETIGAMLQARKQAEMARKRPRGDGDDDAPVKKRNQKATGDVFNLLDF